MADFQEGPIVGERKISADSILLDTPLLKTLTSTVFSPSTTAFPSGSTGIQMYNTVDQVTNFERVRIGTRTSNVFKIASGAGGTGASRTIRILSNSGASDTDTSYSGIDVTGSSVTTVIRGSASTTNGILFQTLTSMTHSSGLYTHVLVAPIINQSGTAGYTGLHINSSETATGSGAKNLLLLQVGSVDKQKVDNFGHTTFDATNTAGGTTGAQTINKPSGTVNFAAAETSLVVTNSLCTTSSIIVCNVRTNDTTAQIKNVVPGAGSFTITLSAAATAETSVGFIVYN